MFRLECRQSVLGSLSEDSWVQHGSIIVSMQNSAKIMTVLNLCPRSRVKITAIEDNVDKSAPAQTVPRSYLSS